MNKKLIPPVSLKTEKHPDDLTSYSIPLSQESVTKKPDNPSFSAFAVMSNDSSPPTPAHFIHWERHSQHSKCPSCTFSGMTEVKQRSGVITWLSCFGIAVIGLNCGCCFLPFFFNALRETWHYCTRCNSLLGVRRPL